MALVRFRGKDHPLVKTITAVGSASECDISVASPHLSRRHALFVRDRKGVLVIDFRSTNGVAVNGLPVEIQRLNEGDVVTLSGATGEQEIRFTFHESSDEGPPPRRPVAASPANAAIRIATLASAARDAGELRAVLDELIAITNADRAGLVIQDGAAAPRVIASFARKRTVQGPAEDTVSLMPGPAKRLREGEDFIFLEDGMKENGQWAHPHAARAAIPILLVRSAICAALRLRGSLHGILQMERALFSEPFSRTAANTVEACRLPLALALAAQAHRQGR